MHIILSIDDVYLLVKKEYGIYKDFTVSVETNVEKPDTTQHPLNIVASSDNDLQLMNTPVWFKVKPDYNYDSCPHFQEWGLIDIEVELREGIREICRIDQYKYSWVQNNQTWDIVKYRKV